MKQLKPCPGCGGKPLRWYSRAAGRAVDLLWIMMGDMPSGYLSKAGWHHTKSDCPVWALAGAEGLRKKEK